MYTSFSQSLITVIMSSWGQCNHSIKLVHHNPSCCNNEDKWFFPPSILMSALSEESVWAALLSQTDLWTPAQNQLETRGWVWQPPLSEVGHWVWSDPLWEDFVKKRHAVVQTLKKKHEWDMQSRVTEERKTRKSETDRRTMGQEDVI